MYLYIFNFVCLYTYICMYMYVYVCMFIYICIYIYIYSYTCEYLYMRICHHHHHHHVMPLAQISLTLPRPSHLTGPLDFILCLYRAVVDKF